MDTLVRRCALPGCSETIEQQADRPARLYCSVEHRREARRRRAEHAHRSDPVSPDTGRPAVTIRDAAATSESTRVRAPDTPGTSASDAPAAGAACPGPAAPGGDGRRGGQPAVTGPALASALTHDTLVRPAPRSRARRWRGAGPHGPADAAVRARDTRRADLVARARAPLGNGPYRVAVVSLKGGVGKTTVAAGVGLALSEQRGDRIVGVDAAPDLGTLADRLTGPLPAGVPDLLAARDRVRSVSDLSRYTGLAGRLVVVAGEQDPGTAEGIRGDQHRQVTRLLGDYFDVLITDCGPGMMHSAARNAVAEADVLVVVGEVAPDGASRASATLDWVAAHGYPEKAADAIVALNCDRAGTIVPIEPVREHFRARARAVVVVPYDPALVAGGRIRAEDLRDGTRDAFLELGALVVDGLAR
ncbi:MinD/ParA family protein [Pseudonocardia sp. C8]|uniref:MinD/ParA family ATP-binding protein n=1 Tax=Pseudonocardia sp. C8 TaxID=2762759 RepID=UPI001642B0F2|nr:MinD/ParA family protein [Pseudonocardia sp. C8]MBC3191886.1 MinD/ParA family protein [Pseudonocardia sp. C8]